MRSAWITIIGIKPVLMVLLMINLSVYVLLIQYTRKQHISGHKIYITSTVVLVAETWKVIFSTVAILTKNHSRAHSFVYTIYTECLREPNDIAKTLFICLLYAIQNNIVFIAIENMESAVYQVTSQLKIVSTALMSRILLNRHLSVQCWVAIMLLFMGVSFVQLEQFQTAELNLNMDNSKSKSFLIGVLATLLVSLLSGIAGVSYEKLIKSEGIEFWVCNFQMHFSGFIASAVVCVVKDLHNIQTLGYFYSYTPAVWLITVISASGGILVSLVVAHLDSITKTFSVGGAVVLSALGSMYLYDFTLGIKFIIGTLLVSVAAYLYN